MPSDLARDDIISRLLKVLRLAQQGVGGERENAEVLLAKLLKKHSLTMADLEGSADGATETLWLPADDADERTILAQLAMSLFGADRKLWRRNGAWEVGVDVTAAERAALIVGWEVYRAAFAEARHALVLGFCLKHDLYAPVGAAPSPMTDEERARARHAMAFAEALPDVQTPGRRLTGGEAGER